MNKFAIAFALLLATAAALPRPDSADAVPANTANNSKTQTDIPKADGKGEKNAGEKDETTNSAKENARAEEAKKVEDKTKENAVTDKQPEDDKKKADDDKKAEDDKKKPKDDKEKAKDDKDGKEKAEKTNSASTVHFTAISAIV
ncbi:hypothetical protein IWQ61_009801, partial [Dispira simplex]